MNDDIVNDYNIIDKHIYDHARVFDHAWVSGNARVYGNARVTDHALVFGNAHVTGNALVRGNALVFGNARVSGNAQVYGNARIIAGIIDGDADIGSPHDLIQVVIGDTVWSRFRTVDSYRTTCTNPDTEMPYYVSDLFDAWQACR